MASACTFILQPSLFHHSKLKQSNFLLQKFNIQIPNYRLSVFPSTSSDWEREEVRWIQEEQRWVREEKRWIREESRWRSERELLSKESDMLRIKIESLKTGTNMDGEVEVGGERLVIPEIMEVTGIIVEEKKEVEALAFEVNVSKRDNDMEKKIEERKVLRMEVQGGDVKKLQVWTWTRISIGRPNVRVGTTEGLPYGARWTGDRHWRDNPSRHATLYRNEFDVMAEHHVEWMPYTNDVLDDLPEICLEGQQFWHSRTPIICLQSVAMHYPDRVMRQFGLRQHIPDATERVFPNGWTRDLYDSYVYRWNHRFDYLQLERIPPISIERYYSWYWHITKRFVLKESSTRLPRYAPRGPVERDLVQGLYMISNEVDDVLAYPEDEDHVKGKCLSIKQIINTILGRHKLERPPPYQPPPSSSFAITYQRRRRRGGQGIHIEEPGEPQPTQDIIVAGPSQPPPTQTQPTRQGRYNLRRHGEQGDI